ncbi:MAG TPA: hypothetical protein VKV40_12895 [Ktedonobacteraceae bacterium]|nr:hypothetical protein [Ktedonobacteraceae bacterium]
MSIINVRVHCPDRSTEFPPDDVEAIEATIEAVVSTALLEIYESVFVENVTVLPSSQCEDEVVEQETCLW